MTWRQALARLRGQRGYSLVEMLVVLVVMGIVTTSLTTVFVAASNSEVDMNTRFQAQLNARLALDVFRRDAHCASSVTLGPAGSPSGPLTAISVTIVLPSTCRSSGTVTWCAEGSGSRFGLYRGGTISGSTCTGGTRYADYLTRPNLFDYTAPSGGSGELPKVKIDLPVNVKPTKTVEGYELQDNVVLKNGTRA
jgi:prepilin-type N-terminal cleavage/methylation domain-containing protein